MASNHDENDQCDQLDNEAELAMLREQIAMLSKQFFHDRQQWLEEKRRLQEAAKVHQVVSSDLQREGCRHGHRESSSLLLCSEAGSEPPGEDASQGSFSTRDATCSSFSSACQSSRSADSRSSSPTAGLAGSTPTELLTAIGELQRQLEETRRQQESASLRWTLERENLQRQIHALISMSGETAPPATSPGGGQQPHSGGVGVGDLPPPSPHPHSDAADLIEERQQLTERVLELEAIVVELQAERENLEQQLCVVAADASRAARRPPRTVEGTAPAADQAPPSAATTATTTTTDAADAAPSSVFATATAAAAAAEQGSFATAACIALAPSSRPSSPPLAQPQTPSPGPAAKGTPPAAGGGGGGAEGGPPRWGWAMTLRDSVQLPELLSEKAEMERELRKYREECVAVPRAEYADLSSVHKQMAFMEAELQQLRQEVEEAVQQREAAEAQLAAVYEGGVVVSQEEYQQLLRQAAEARAGRPSASSGGSASASSGGAAAVTAEEHRRLLAAARERDALAQQLVVMQAELAAAATEAAEALAAAEAARLSAAVDADAAAGGGADADGADGSDIRHEVVMLREQLADAVGAAVAESSRLGARVRELEEEVDRLKLENARLLAESGAVRSALASGKLQANDSARAAAVAAEEARTAAVGELAGMQMRVQRLEAELAAARKAEEEAWAQKEELLVELTAVRDAAVRTTGALADCQVAREAAEQQAAAAAREVAAATEELVAAKLELAEAREMEVLFKRDVLKSKRMLHGLPQEWMAEAAAAAGLCSGGSGWASRAGSSSGGGSGIERRRTHSRGGSGVSFVSAAASSVDVTEVMEGVMEEEGAGVGAGAAGAGRDGSGEVVGM